MATHLLAKIRIRGTSPTTAVAAVLYVVDVPVAHAVKQRVLNVSLVGRLAVSQEYLNDVISVIP